MNHYLALAQAILREVRRPLTPRQIINIAYKQGLVPNHLHGQTQHKTLQARLSEDILNRRDNSAFFRNEPGKFFLREFISDATLPNQYRTPIVARRRTRELPSHDALAFSSALIGAEAVRTQALASSWVEENISKSRYRYVHSINERSIEDALVWSFVVVAKGTKVLSFRHGRYREGRDGFLQKRSIGFFTMVVDRDLNLFDQYDHGILNSGVRAVSLDLDLPHEVIGAPSPPASLDAYLLSVENGHSDILALIMFECPDWFEPLNKRLSINDLHWLDVSCAPNDPSDFDPWSKLALEHVRSTNKVGV